MTQAFALGIRAQTSGMYRVGGTPRDGFSGNATLALKRDDAPWAVAEFIFQKNGFELGLIAPICDWVKIKSKSRSTGASGYAAILSVTIRRYTAACECQ